MFCLCPPLCLVFLYMVWVCSNLIDLHVAVQLSGLPKWLSGKGSSCSAENAGHLSSIPGSGRSPGGEKDNPLQYSCLENHMDRGAWWATVHGGVNTLYFLHYFTFLCNLEITILICALYIISLGHWILHSSMSNFPNFFLSFVDFILTKREKTILKKIKHCMWILLRYYKYFFNPDVLKSFSKESVWTRSSDHSFLAYFYSISNPAS